MRRTLALVALVVVTWPHVAVMRCDAAPHAARGDAASVVADHAHEGLGCATIMACGAAMIEGAIDERVAEPAAPPPLHVTTPSTAPTTADLTADPPPPRRHA